MSAIFGILDLAGRPLDDAWIKSMQQDMAHRGPDGQGLYREDSVALGHLLLQVTPESIYDNSPYEEDGLVITANARLDERDALMDKLNIVGEERSKITDPQLLLRSYRKEGNNFIKNIYGDFSFAIWNKQKKELFCARDQMGIKPFLYYFQDNRFVFSTELKAIANLPFVDTGIDNYYLRNRALAICDEHHKTSLKNIYRLNSASTLLLNNVSLDIKQYWQPKYKRNKKFKTEEDSAAAVKALLDKIMTDHIRVIGKVGATLSGGLDSSTIVCMAAKKLNEAGKKITTVSSVYTPGLEDEDDPDEMEFIAAIIEQEPNIDPVFVHHSDHSFIAGVYEKINKNYEPPNGFYYVDEALNKKFHLRSVRRVLTGYLGDATVTNTSINPIPILFTSARFGALIKLLSQYKKNGGQPIPAIVKNAVLNGLTPKFFQKAWAKYRGSFDTSRDIDMLPLKLSPQDKLVLQNKIHRTFQISNYSTGDLAANIWPNRLHLFDEDWDCGASYHQIETTYPLCDRRLVELLLQLPVEHFHTGGERRGLIRKAMAGVLPEKVRIRTRKGSYAPGYTKLVKSEMEEIADFMQNIKVTNDLGNLLDMQKLKIELENLSKSKNEDSFTFKSWTLLELIMWSYFNHWFEKSKLNSK
jgi:asparagine synthase (glutamine-hydrolysing)